MVTDWASRRAELSPERPAVVQGETGKTWTYQAMAERAARIAGWLLTRGVGPGDRVALLGLNDLAHVDLWLVAGMTGIAVLPLNWRLSAEALAPQVDLIRPKLLIYETAWADVAKALATGRPWLEPIDAGDNWARWEEYWKTQTPVKPARIPPETPSMYLFTGGSTGEPKAVAIPHRQVFYNAVNTVIGWGLTLHDRAPVVTPMFHTGGYHVLLTPLYLVGGTVVIFRRFDPVAMIDAVYRYGLTRLFMVPSMYAMMADTSMSLVGSPLVWAISGGAPCPEPIIQRYRGWGIPLIQGYGLTEVGPNCFAARDPATQPADAVGVPVFHLEIALRDDDGQPVSDGAVGELWLRGPTVSLGYYGMPLEDQREFDADGYFHTGDLAQIVSDGLVRIVGRKKDMFISGGENVYPAAIEATLARHPAIQDVAVVGVPDPTWGEVGAAFVVRKPGTSWDPESWARWVAERLGRYQVPKQWISVAQLPLTPMGKVDKRKLQAEWQKGGSGGVSA
ncbi:MAG: AMP-binding protein [Sulfobacillus sp.]|nr:AMP-binding protein [Sulfobacillus sp.]